MKKTTLYTFVQTLNGKRFIDLNFNNQKIIKTVFPEIHDNCVIRCAMYQGRKIDLAITVNEITKYLAFRSNKSFVAYKGDVKEIIRVLFSIGLSYETINVLLKFINKTEIDNLNFSNEFLRDDYPNSLDLINDEFSDKTKIIKLLNYFLIEEKNGLCVDYFLFGNEKNGDIVSSKAIVEGISNSKNNYKNIKIGPFTLTKKSMDECVLKISFSKYKKIIEKNLDY